MTLTCPCMFMTRTVLVLLQTTNCSGLRGIKWTELTVMSVATLPTAGLNVWRHSVVFTFHNYKKTDKKVTNLPQYLTMNNNSFVYLAAAFFSVGHFIDILVLSMIWNDLFCVCVDHISIWWQTFNFVFLSLKHWFQLYSRTVRTHFASVTTLNNWETIAEMRSYTFRWCSRCRSTSSLLKPLIIIIEHYINGKIGNAKNVLFACLI